MADHHDQRNDYERKLVHDPKHAGEISMLEQSILEDWHTMHPLTRNNTLERLTYLNTMARTRS